MNLSPVTANVRCAGEPHRLMWRDGGLTAADHPDPERERALTALGGETYRCLQLLDVWERHVDDLDVLLLASRGANDPVERGGHDQDHVHVHGQQGVLYRGSYTSHGWSSYAPLSATMRGGARVPDLRDVLRLDGRLPDRLAAQVIDHWTALLERGDGRAGAARPRLHAALYGRFAAVVREWLGELSVRVDLEMTAPGTPRSIRRDDGAILVALPFAWLSEVWSPGLAVVADRLVLAAESPGHGRVELVALDAGLVEHRVTLEDQPGIV